MLQVRPPDVGKAHQVLFVVVASARNHRVAVLHANAPHQVGQEVGRHVAVVHHAHRVAHLAVLESAAHAVEHGAAHVVVVQIELGVARNFKRVGLDALRREQKVRVLQVVAQHVVQEHQVVLAVLGKLNEAPVDFGRNLHHRQHRFAAQLGPQPNGQVDRGVVEFGKRQVVLQNHRKNGRTDLVDVKLADVVFLALSQVLLVDDFYSFELQGDHELGVGGLDPVVEHVNFRLDRVQQVVGIPTP